MLSLFKNLKLLIKMYPEKYFQIIVPLIKSEDNCKAFPRIHA